MSARTRVIALFWRVVTRGRICGRSFYMGRPKHISFADGGKISVGDATRIESGTRMVAHAPLDIGAHVYIGQNCTLIAFATLEIGDRTLIGENVSVHTEDHGPFTDRNRYTTKDVKIGQDCWIGAGAVITKGVTVGDRTTIGANAVVTKDVPPDSLAVGVPARVRRSLR